MIEALLRMELKVGSTGSEKSVVCQGMSGGGVHMFHLLSLIWKQDVRFHHWVVVDMKKYTSCQLEDAFAPMYTKY